MVATVVLDGANITQAENTTNFTAFKISGTGGGPTIAVADGAIEGSGAVTAVVSRQRVAIYYDLGAGNELDFTGGGAEEGQIIAIWAQFLAPALLQSQSAGGFGIFLATATPQTNYALYYFHGNDTNAAGEKRLLLDPTFTASSTAGSGLTTSSVRYIGVFADVGGTTARFDNLIMDRADVLSGLRVYGTSTTDDLMGDLLADEATNKYGVIKPLNESGTAIELAGRLLLGDDVGTNAATLTDVNKNIFLAEPTYYNGTSVVNSVPLDFFSINFVGNGTGATDITIGKKVGTGDSASGRSGYNVVGNDTYNLGLDFDDGNVNASKIYGTKFQNCSGVISFGTNTAHEAVGVEFDNCAQVDMVGGVLGRAMRFVNFAGTTGALLWNENIDVAFSDFINNNRAIQHPGSAGSPYDYSGMIFNGNTFDGNNTSGVGITVNKLAGSNPITSTGSAITYTASFSLTMTNIPQDTRVVIVNASTRTELFTSVVGAPGTAVYSHAGGETVDIMFHANDYEPDISNIYDFTLANADVTLQINMFADLDYENP